MFFLDLGQGETYFSGNFHQNKQESKKFQLIHTSHAIGTISLQQKQTYGHRKTPILWFKQIRKASLSMNYCYDILLPTSTSYKMKTQYEKVPIMRNVYTTQNFLPL